MTILRSGTSQKYADNWASAFGAKKKVAGKSAKKKSKSVKKKLKKKLKKKNK